MRTIDESRKEFDMKLLETAGKVDCLRIITLIACCFISIEGVSAFGDVSNERSTVKRIGSEGRDSHDTSVDEIDSRMVFKSVRDKLLIVQCEDSTGSGFVCTIDGKPYFVTNRHVVKGQRRVAAIFENGKELRLGKFEVAEGDVDLVRFAVATNQPALSLSPKVPEMNQAIVVFGNSDGGNVLTDLPGKILGIGPEKIEISSKIVHGNSGSAVLNGRGEVLGVATSAVQMSDPQDWVKQDTRFTEVRRYALRMNGIRWIGTTLKALNKQLAEEDRKQRVELGILPEVTASFKAPSMRILKYQTYGPASYWVSGNIVLGLSNSRGIKNPVVRVVMLLECGARRLVMDAVSCEPEGEYKYSSIPIYTYGMRNSSGSFFEVGNSLGVMYLEGLSYYQRPFACKSAKNISYVCKPKYLPRDGQSGFVVPRDILTIGMEPKIVAFRFECWQNGSLACAYNSLRPNTLNAKGVPVDWFIINRYTKLFDYAKTLWSSF